MTSQGADKAGVNLSYAAIIAAVSLPVTGLLAGLGYLILSLAEAGLFN